MSVRVLFMGMLGAFSAIPLERLLSANVDVIAVVVPAPYPSDIPIRVLDLPRLPRADFTLQSAVQRNIVQLARDHAIPVVEVSDVRHPQTLSLLRALQPDLIVVACFPFILPNALLQIAKHGGWNVHPSLLPKLRGPSPLFWVFHEDCCAGVTLHAMSARADAGDIIAQMPLDFPDGFTYAEAEHVVAQWGARLLLDALRDLERGTLHPSPQDERNASYFASPTENDFVVTADWSARRAFNFIRGVSGFGQPMLRIGDEQWIVRDALEYRAGERLSHSYRIVGGECLLQCADGIVRVRVQPR